MTRACILYPGEMGTAVSRLLVANGCEVVSCLAGRSARTREGASRSGVLAAPTLDDAVKHSDLVISLVAQSAVVPTASEFAAAARRTGHRPIYLDANSVSPATMRRVRAVVEGAGGDCVDGAFIGNSAELGGRTTLYVSGPSALTAKAIIRNAFRVKTLGADLGSASAFKLTMYGFNKGLVAIFLEMMSAAQSMGQTRELLESLRAYYPGSVETVERLLPTYPRHARRRAEELREVEEWLHDIGESGAMATATRSILEELARLQLSASDARNAEAIATAFARARRWQVTGDEGGGR